MAETGNLIAGSVVLHLVVGWNRWVGDVSNGLARLRINKHKWAGSCRVAFGMVAGRVLGRW